MLIAGVMRLAIPSSTAGGAQRGAGGRQTQVTAVAASMRPFTDRIEALGVAKGIQSVNLSANNTERVTSVRFQDGAFVHRGDILVQLKATEETANVSQARAAVDVAQANYDRYNALAQGGFLAPAAMDQYRSALEQARANLAAAQSRQADRVIRAPFAGRLGLTDIAPGALISPGATIVTLDDVSTVRVDFTVPDRFLPVLRVGAPIQARADPYPDRVITGRIADIDTRIDPNTHAIRARAEFANADGALVPGMLMHVQIENGQRQAVALPESAVQSQSDQSFVYVIAHQEDRTIARQTPVTVGVNENGFVEIRDGLRAGVQVVADGLDRVEPDAPIRVGPARGARVGVGDNPTARTAADGLRSTTP
ncbi:MAG: efflux RND transporter periplasmic adaptor subunit [Proteobacteria bacterium]|nr:efflux RND transporter periplasmic adaptor subunit [Pseudomonadota bacterium]